MTKTYQHLNRWTMPRDYFGASWPEWYVVIGRNRDSSALDRANFDAMLRELKRLPEVEVMTPSNRYDDSLIEADSVQVIRESHWAYGWVEWIGVHESNTAACELADRLLGKIEGYPVLDEELWSEYEDEECRQTWENCFNERERAEYLRKHVHLPVEYPPYGMTVYQALRAAVKGDWSVAASLLPCPSDLIA